MSRILAIDLGKFKSVTCLLDSDTNQTEFWSMATDRQYLLAVLKNYHPAWAPPAGRMIIPNEPPAMASMT